MQVTFTHLYQNLEFKQMRQKSWLAEIYSVGYFISIFLLLTPALSLAETTNWYALGLKYERNGQYQEAIDSYTKASDSGLSDAKLALGDYVGTK